MIVVDASVAAQAVSGLDDRNIEAARRLVQGPLCAPHLLDIEVASALRSMLRRNEIPEPVARRALRRLSRLPIDRLPHSPLIERCWQLRDNLSVYDASYVALAEVLGATLLTSDQRLARSPGIRCDVELLT